MHGTASEDVKMQMMHRLTAVCPGIRDHPVAAVGQTDRPRRVSSQQEERPEFGPIRGLGQGRDVPARNHEQMRRGLRVQIPKHHPVIIFGDQGNRVLTTRDTTKDTGLRHGIGHVQGDPSR